MTAAVKVMVNTFLQTKHYTQLHSTLCDQWGTCHSLSAAVKLMEAHGVKLAPAEEKRLSELPEDRMIDQLVMKMPQQTREQFEHFFLQLSFIASTTTRLRTALETGDASAIEEALASAENVGVLPYIMKMAVSQAGQEVKASEDGHAAWLHKTDETMEPLLRSTQTAMVTQKALAQAKTEIAAYRGEAKEKSKAVLLGMSSGNDKNLVASIYNTWADYCRKQKREAEIRKDYQEEIDQANKALFEYKSAQLAGIKNVMNRNSKEGDADMMWKVIKALADEAEWFKQRKAGEEEARALKEQLASFSQTAASNAKKVMATMNTGNDEALRAMVFATWQEYIATYKKDKEMNDAVKAAEQQVKAFMAKQKDGATSVLSRMQGASEGGLIASSFKGWAEVLQDAQKQEHINQMMNSKASQLGDFNSRNKAGAMNATQKVAYLQDIQFMLWAFTVIKREIKVERAKRYFKDKNEKKKQDLIGVKGLFKNFASELETNLKKGTPRLEGKEGKAEKGSPKAAR